MTTAWKLVAGPRDGADPRVELTAATGRRVTVRAAQSSEVTFTINGRHPQAAGLVDLASDVWCLRDRELLHRGRLAPSTFGIDTDRHTETLSAPSYRALLAARFLRAGDKRAFTAEDQASIAWQLVQIAQGRPGGNLGITRGVGQTSGFLRSRQFDSEQSIASALDSLAVQDTGGMAWDVDEHLRLNLYHGGRGRQTDVVLELGGAVARVDGAFLPADHYANAVAGTRSGDQRAPEYRDAADVATRPEGRWEAVRPFPDVLEQATLASATAAALADLQVKRPALTLTLRPGRYPGREALWVADTCLVRLRSGRRTLDERLRVEELTFEAGDDGTETVRVTVGHPAPAGDAARLRDYDARLAVLERR